MHNILVCDDDHDIVAALKIYLSGGEYRVFEAYNGAEAVEAVRKNDIHLVLMDIMMPELDGIAATAAIRRESNAPIILLTAKSESSDKVLGLNVGADDYVTKPFNPLELVARVKSQLRRYVRLGSIDGKAGQKASEQREGVYATGGLVVDDKQKIVSMDGQPVAVTPIEFGILCYLTRHAGRVFSIEQIYEAVWNEPAYNPENTVAVHIRRIREKIEIDPKNPRYLKVVWGIGYKMEKL